MRLVSRKGWQTVVATAAVCFSALAAAHAATTNTPASVAVFVVESEAAMDKMMAGMTIKPIGDVYHDFTAMMIPHHQGAIDMAQAESRCGRNEQPRRRATKNSSLCRE